MNTFAGTPLTVVRAVLLDALVQAARTDENVAIAFVTSARNVLPTMQAGGERSIWTEIMTEMEREVDSRAEAEWATPFSQPIDDHREHESDGAKHRSMLEPAPTPSPTTWNCYFRPFRETQTI